MPSPVPPSEIKATIPSASGSFCAKFLAVLQLPKLFYEFYSWMINEDGSFTGDFIADLCAVQCTCDGSVVPPPDPGDTGGPAAPLNVQATDGAFSTKVVVTWSSVVAATTYEVLRGTTDSFALATVIGTTTGLLSTTYDDSTVAEGQVYYYWVRAYNGALRGVTSAPDTGYSVGAVTAVTDLKASRGFYASTVTGFTTGTGTLALVFTASSGANAYDIYRGTTNVFADATKIDSNRMPFDTSRKTSLCSPTPCTQPMFINNSGHLLYYDSPPSIVQRYYYWVVSKVVSGETVQAVSAESSSAFGWIVFDSTVASQVLGYDVVSVGITPVTSAQTRAFLVLVGAVAGGAGGNGTLGGGGGGGAGIITGYFDMVAGPNRRFKLYSETAAGGVSEADGADSVGATLYYDDGGGSFVPIMVAGTAGGGVWTPPAGGAGGVSGSLPGPLVVTGEDGEAGFDGEAASGTFGGRGGCAFGFVRSNPHNFPNTWNIATESGRSTAGGGGSDALAGNPTLADGGVGSTGYAIIVYY